MTPGDLARECSAALDLAHKLGQPPEDASVMLVTPHGWTPPKGFPRGRLVCVTRQNEAVRYFPAARLGRWLLVQADAIEAGRRP